MSKRKQKKYSAELKLLAVQDYLAGKGSLRRICKKYEIKDNRQLRNWICSIMVIKTLEGAPTPQILLNDKRVEAHRIGDSNNNQLVSDKFDEAVALDLDTHPLFHSYR